MISYVVCYQTRVDLTPNARLRNRFESQLNRLESSGSEYIEHFKVIYLVNGNAMRSHDRANM